MQAVPIFGPLFDLLLYSNTLKVDSPNQKEGVFVSSDDYTPFVSPMCA